MWDTSLKLSKKAAKEQKETALKALEEHFDFNYTSDELVGVWKSLRACMLREVKRIGKDTASSQWKYFNQMQFLRPSNADVVIDRARNVALKIVPCNMLLPQQCCVKSCLV